MVATGAVPSTGKVIELGIQCPYRHPGQQIVMAEAKRFNVLPAGRRWRKTTLFMRIAIDNSLRGAYVLWTAPTFDQVRIGWDEMTRACGTTVKFNETRMTATFPGSGRTIFRSLDNPDNARGHSANMVIVDEAPLVVVNAWEEVLRPMLSDTGGGAWLGGTPKGRNWYWDIWKLAKSAPDMMSWQAPTLGAEIVEGQLIRKPHPLENTDFPWDELLRLWQTMPERSFRQEFLAEFLEDGGGVFRGVRALSTLQKGFYNRDHEYVIGADWGRTGDFTVFCVLDATAGQQVDFDRFNMVDYSIQSDRLLALCEKWHPAMVVPEANSIGMPIIDALRRKNIPMMPFVTTNASKMKAIDALALAFERRELHLLQNETQLDELEAFESQQLPGGGIRYSAPDNKHDDCVIALALAWTMAKKVDYSFLGRGREQPEEVPFERIMAAHRAGVRVQDFHGEVENTDESFIAT